MSGAPLRFFVRWKSLLLSVAQLHYLTVIQREQERQMGWWFVLWLSTGAVVPIVWLLDLIVGKLAVRAAPEQAGLVSREVVSQVAAE